MILILTSAGDTHADHVEGLLRDRGASCVRFDPAGFPRARITMAYASDGPSRCTLRRDDEDIDLGSLGAVWYRRPGAPSAHEDIRDEQTRVFVEQESRAFLQDLWQSLDCRWLPGTHATVRDASLKASQLKVAAALGFELPPTLLTNDPADLLDFYRQHDGRIVSKLVAQSIHTTVGPTFARYTELVSKRDLANANALSYCPVILQAYVPKRVELRITVVGRQVFAAEIHSQVSNHTRVDWRRYDDGQTPYRSHALPVGIESCCVALVEELGLCYGAIDMVLTPDGRYVFLELNPNGQYLWIEQETGLPISDAICDLLMVGSGVRESLQPGSRGVG